MRLQILLLVSLFPSLAQGADITLPDYPYWDNSVFEVSESHIEEAGSAYCATGEEEAVAFFIGPLAYQSFDDLCSASDEDIPALLGDLYISGYFGGIWLRDALIPEETNIYQSLLRSGSVAAGSQRALFTAVTAAAGRPLKRAQEGGNANVLLANKKALPALLAGYGYNLGYIEVILENPPEGLEGPIPSLDCGTHFLDCQSADIPLTVLNDYESAITKLMDPPNARWEQMNTLVDDYGIPAVEEGASVWDDILAEDDISLNAYLPLVDSSIGFLMVTEAVNLAAMTAISEGQPDDGRCALTLQSGLALWTGAYFMGLASSAPEGTFPELACNTNTHP